MRTLTAYDCWGIKVQLEFYVAPFLRLSSPWAVQNVVEGAEHCKEKQTKIAQVLHAAFGFPCNCLLQHPPDMKIKLLGDARP